MDTNEETDSYGSSASNVLLELSQILSEKAKKLQEMAIGSSSSGSAPQYGSGSSTKSQSRWSPRNDLSLSSFPRRRGFSEREDVLARADQLRKSIKPSPGTGSSGKRKRTDDSDYVVITVCEMVEKPSGGFQRKARGQCIEITDAQRSDDYISFAIKAANALDLLPLPSSYLCLFKAAGGAVIANKEIMVNKKLRPWSLGNYLSLLKKSPSNVKIGVAYVYDDLNKSEEFSKSSEPEDPPHSVKLEAPAAKKRRVVKSKEVTDSPERLHSKISGTTRDNPLVVGSKNTQESKNEGTQSVSLNAQVQQFDYKVLAEATSNFSADAKLGEGGFGVVFKGMLNGSFVAIKRLSLAGARAVAGVSVHESASPNPDIMAQLYSEVMALSRCRHRNLVELMGFCMSPPILIYEFMEKGNLHHLLYEGSQVLTWQQRSKALKDVCRGLVWLHSASPAMLHGDLKASNVLVDGNFNAKIGDFGFTQEMPYTVTGSVTLKTAKCIAKTLGYAAPEIDTCHHSVKTDVYSYGILALETYSNCKPYDRKRKDRLLVEHFDAKLNQEALFGEIACAGAGPLAPYLMQLYYKIISNCLKKHSDRPLSQQVMNWWNSTNF